MGLLNYIFGDDPLPRRQDWPSQDDVALARKSDMTYASPMAGLLTNPQTQIKGLSASAAEAAHKTGTPLNNAKMGLYDPAVRDQLYAAWLAAQRSSVSSLGFNPSRMAFVPASEPQMNASGAYYPETDQIMSRLSAPSNPVHESMHRGLNQMRDAGVSMTMPNAKPDDGQLKEEDIVRVLMADQYGPVEMDRNPKEVKKAQERIHYWEKWGPEGYYYAYGRDPRAYLEQMAQQVLMRQNPAIKRAR